MTFVSVFWTSGSAAQYQENMWYRMDVCMNKYLKIQCSLCFGFAGNRDCRQACADTAKNNIQCLLKELQQAAAAILTLCQFRCTATLSQTFRTCIVEIKKYKWSTKAQSDWPNFLTCSTWMNALCIAVFTICQSHMLILWYQYIYNVLLPWHLLYVLSQQCNSVSLNGHN